VLRALKKEVRDASGVDTERLSKNVSVQIIFAEVPAKKIAKNGIQPKV